jgi:hypothetical protein
MTDPHPGLRMSDLATVPQAQQRDAGASGSLGGLRPCPSCGRLWEPKLHYREDIGQLVATDRDPSVCPRCQPTRAAQL